MWLAREDEVIEGVTMMVDQVCRNMLLFAMKPLNVVPNNRRVRWKLVAINGHAKLLDTDAHSESLIPKHYLDSFAVEQVDLESKARG
jgi:hypothetical protein